MSIQILHYEFLGPIKISEWGPPMEKLVYILFAKIKDGFQVIYVSEVEKTKQKDFFTQNEKSKCWIQHTGSEELLYLAIYPMTNSIENERQKVVQKIISKYKPSCNTD